MAVAESSGPPPQPVRLQTWFPGLTLITVVAAFALVVLGGVVRVTGSGLGCPDWPLCHGGFLPPLELKAIIEYSHRLVASALLGPLIVATCAATWILHRRQPWLIALATVSVALLLIQALLGGASVLTELSGQIVAAHFALAEALLACLTVVMVVAYRGPLSFRHQIDGGDGAARFPFLLLISGLGVYVVLISGSIVTVSGATAACADWPLCQGQIVPGNELALIHMAHRAVAAIVGVVLMYTLYTGICGVTRAPQLRWLSGIAAALFLAQVAIGAATVFLKFPAEWRALHLSLGTLLWGTMVALAALSLVKSRIQRQEVVHA